LRRLVGTDPNIHAIVTDFISIVLCFASATMSAELLDANIIQYRRLKKDSTPLQRGIIRHVILCLDLSDSMTQTDFKPTRALLTLRLSLTYIREFFDQNPISQLAVVILRNGIAKTISHLSGNPNQHLGAIKAEMRQEPRGNPSLQNALEVSAALLSGAPSHGTREVVIVLGALLTSDPGDIYQTIRRCAKQRVRVNVVGMGARMYICGEIVGRTNGGDERGYGIAVDEPSLRDLLLATTTPPEIRGSGAGGPAAAPTALASLLPMGFPSRMAEEWPSLCACHNEPSRGGYQCPQCMIKVCALPRECPACGMTLILSTHLARSYHHLFPLRGWVVVSWRRARERGSVECRSCLSKFPEIPRAERGDGTMGNGGMEGGDGKAKAGSKRNEKEKDGQQGRDAEGVASESGRYECETCQNHFCVDCDVFCHDVLHNCPGCQGQAELPGLAVQEPNGNVGAAAASSGQVRQSLDAMDTS
jgi:transcription initiation factor TFIIH subunit 2